MPGRPTTTSAGLPPGSVARWAWVNGPVLAGASSKGTKRRSSVLPELPLQEGPRLGEGDRARGGGGAGELRRHVRGDEVAPGREEPAELGEGRAELLQGEAQPGADAPGVGGAAAAREAATEDEAEPVAGPDPRDPGRPAGRALRRAARDLLHRASLAPAGRGRRGICRALRPIGPVLAYSFGMPLRARRIAGDGEERAVGAEDHAAWVSRGGGRRRRGAGADGRARAAGRPTPAGRRPRPSGDRRRRGSSARARTCTPPAVTRAGEPARDLPRLHLRRPEEGPRRDGARPGRAHDRRQRRPARLVPPRPARRARRHGLQGAELPGEAGTHLVGGRPRRLRATAST